MTRLWGAWQEFWFREAPAPALDWLRAGLGVTLLAAYAPLWNRLDELWSQFQFTNRGLLGSRRKKILVSQMLEAEGVPKARIDAIRVPIGLDLGGAT